MTTMEKLQKAEEYMRPLLPARPKIGVILGSGLGGLAETIKGAKCIPYADVPGMKAATAPGHAGRFVFGKLGGKDALLMQGRLHYYEGHSMEEIVFPVRLMRRLGIELLIVTNAAGSVNTQYWVGDFMLIRDHINMMGTNPLIGPNEDELGERFPDMSCAYPKSLRDTAKKCAEKMGIHLREGVYMGLTGPSYETPSEIRMFRLLGADAVGMSTVPEVIAAAHMKLPVLGISLITNMAAGILEQPLSGEEVIRVGQERGADLQALVTRIAKEVRL